MVKLSILLYIFFLFVKITTVILSLNYPASAGECLTMQRFARICNVTWQPEFQFSYLSFSAEAHPL